MHRFEITKAEAEDGATYYFSVEGMESNKISVHIDGKYIHVFKIFLCGFIYIRELCWYVGLLVFNLMDSI